MPATAAPVIAAENQPLQRSTYGPPAPGVIRTTANNRVSIRLRRTVVAKVVAPAHAHATPPGLIYPLDDRGAHRSPRPGFTLRANTCHSAQMVLALLDRATAVWLRRATVSRREMRQRVKRPRARSDRRGQRFATVVRIGWLSKRFLTAARIGPAAAVTVSTPAERAVFPRHERSDAGAIPLLRSLRSTLGARALPVVRREELRRRFRR